jgi:hypothetical protein
MIYSPRKTTEISIRIAGIRTWDMTDMNHFTVRHGILQAVSGTVNRNVLCPQRGSIPSTSDSMSAKFSPLD